MKLTILALVLLSFLSCGSDNNDPDGTSAALPTEVEIGAGTYLIGCFHNKLASEGIGTTIYTKSTMALNSDGTGTNFFELYDDAGCTNLQGSGSTNVLSFETVIVNGERVLKMQQDDGSSTMEFWIGYKQVGDSIFIDVDYSDNESGPYLAEPTPAELSAFMNDPAEQGIEFQKL